MSVCLSGAHSVYSFAEISILGDFNAHQYYLWLSSPFTDHTEEQPCKFTILHELEQLDLVKDMVEHDIELMKSDPTA
ncbi:hypothetical protein E2C01_035374 [Portunus trituberculatus]|uniref:Endonuclease/exonuclease/phosphatase domain-containing protein n=1 Tax=Portunus trituberculatus TaxID=210409 RepID=A0A5B7F419_PORTR|nr:hypothetical protein [Portunus trituberculatus]